MHMIVKFHTKRQIISIIWYRSQLTLILGAKCTDSVAITTDTKVMGIERTFLGHEHKISGELRNVIFGCAGAVGVINIFRKYIVGDVIILRDSLEKYTDENLLCKLKEIIFTFKCARVSQYFCLKIMVARLFPHQNHLLSIFDRLPAR